MNGLPQSPTHNGEVWYVVSGEVCVVSGEVCVVSGEVYVVSGEVCVVSGEVCVVRCVWWVWRGSSKGSAVRL